ncbi:GNAT family N-acetyltransferase [Arenibacterium sp. CAU 1754]
MELGDGVFDVPAGKVATIVTHLEMRARANLRPVPAPDGITIRRIDAPATDWYRDLFLRVGGQDWLWFSRLNMGRDDLHTILNDPKVEVYAVERDGVAQGLLELDFRQPGDCELAFFGLTRALIGTGAGRHLMNHAISRAWAAPITRFHVHTCTLDSPGALSFYRRSGFTPIRQQVEIADDPRVTGKLPETAGPQIPIYR